MSKEALKSIADDFGFKGLWFDEEVPVLVLETGDHVALRKETNTAMLPNAYLDFKVLEALHSFLVEIGWLND